MLISKRTQCFKNRKYIFGAKLLCTTETKKMDKEGENQVHQESQILDNIGI